MSLSANTAVRMADRRRYLADNRHRLTIDADVHPTDRAALPNDIKEQIKTDPNYFHGRPILSENLLATMTRAHVDMALCWQNPAMLSYGDDPAENAARLTAANDRIAALADTHPTRVIPGGWTDPKALGVQAACRLAEHCVLNLAMPVVKMNPAQNAYPIDSDMVIEVVDVIVGLGAVPAFHFGADTPFTPTEGLVKIAERHPDHPVIAVHMGGGGGHFVVSEDTYQSARAAGLSHPNIFYPISAKRDAHLVSDLITYAEAGPPFCHNLALATDTPYCDMTWVMGGWRATLDALASGANQGDPRLAANPDLFDGEMIQAIRGGNFANLMIAAYDRILAGLDL